MVRATCGWLSRGWECTRCITKTDTHLDSLQTVTAMLPVVLARSGWGFPNESHPFVGS